MKITQLMLSKGFGGAERYFVDLSLALADAYFEIQVICHQDFVKREALASHSAIRVAGVNIRNQWDLWGSYQIARQIDAFCPDVLHAHLARGALIGGRIAHKRGIPLVVKTHNYVDLKYYRHVDRFITTTVDQCNYLREQGIAAWRIAVIPNFSSLSPVAHVRRHIPPQPIFVTLGRMVAKKGFDVLLDAFADYLRFGNHGSLLIGGDGSDYSALVKQADRLGITPHVEFSGWIDDVRTFITRGDIFILPSRDEPFGIVALEAMAAGLPIITTLTQGPREILDDRTAYFVPIGDSANLAAAMRKATANPQDTLAKAHTALGHFHQYYAKDIVIPQLVSLYRSMISRPAD